MAMARVVDRGRDRDRVDRARGFRSFKRPPCATAVKLAPMRSPARAAVLLAVLLASAALAAVGCARGVDDADPAETGEPAEPSGSRALEAGAPGVLPAPPDRDAGKPTPPGDGGSPPAANAFTGTVGGKGLAPTESFAVTEGGASPKALALGLRNRTTFCSDFATGIDRAGATSLVFYVEATTSPSITSGTFAIGTSNGVKTRARFREADGQCFNTLSPSKEWATAGTVNITKLGAANVVGTFTLDFGTDRVSGAFDAPLCTSTGAPVSACAP